MGCDTKDHRRHLSFTFSPAQTAHSVPPYGRRGGRHPHNEVFSTDWWLFGGGQDECRFGDGANSLRAQSDTVERLPAGLEQRDPAFARGAQTADELVAGAVVRMQVAALGRR